MLSRVADSLYWMSRYLERAEHTARLLDVNLNLMLDENANSADRRWERLLASLGKPKRVEWKGNPYAMTHALSVEVTVDSSVLSCIMKARENARHVREQISTEQWHRLNSLYLDVTRPELRTLMASEAAQPSSDAPTAFLQQVMEAVHQFQGVTDSTMSHGEGWHFIQVGRFLERATATALLLEAYHTELWAENDKRVESNEYLEWMGLLRSATAFEAYCKVYTADLTPEKILEFLLLDEEFPHSIRFSIESIRQALDRIQDDAGGTRAEPLRKLAGRAASALAYASVDEILQGDVVAYLRNIQARCQDMHEAIYHLYVDYSVQAALAG
ncbi:alpha-E domain-containing protein [Granulicella cerasi]|uniref:Alpha-E domain-containing protein n=1 Tax=Granulicella cerasi TaxID=741063 RepID=A0ABW1ZED7_9BACT|nr:alpha-E domain-containing protein [Granulicella cerasi]